MIQLTRLNGNSLVVNSDLIKFVEQAPDTVLTLVSGEKVIVRENAGEVLNRILEFRRSILQGFQLAEDKAGVISTTGASEEVSNEQAER
jgi:flagellar protein FlbD